MRLEVEEDDEVWVVAEPGVNCSEDAPHAARTSDASAARAAVPLAARIERHREQRYRSGTIR